MSDDCLFCKIIAGEIPATEVYRDDDVFAFEDINPTAPTHTLVIPIKHLKDIAAAAEEDAELLGKLMLAANKIAAEKGLSEGGFRYVINTGRHGGQTVFHLHLHIIGGRQMTWPPG
ncbi:MAG: histidine triad nucleotide-binding protein [Gammaproteobacteria bacterium]|nr:histidine triad nucleotide-binding protein [Gammaproteobacteria bacterium]MDD9896147.1 histidine triad nucleotide-binding protein [Gammaproteobacteria bacterium]MDD9959862.1 histidine triad nucleotide-binding protein [Gammaproteobacteria bacterium]